jgi:DNA-binding LacI/PurR family transcriptional regulator
VADRAVSGRRPTIHDVAERAGVSKSLVSLVMRGEPQVREDKRARVLAAADELGYRMNVAARAMSAVRSGTVGVLVADLRNPALVDVVEAASEVLHAGGLSPLLSIAVLPARRPGTAAHLDGGSIGTLRDLRVEGVLVVGSVPDRSALAQMLGDLPVVAASAQAEGLRGDVVRTDDAAGMRLVVDHLVGRGHRRIAHAGGLGGAVAVDRLQGYRRAMDEHGLAGECLVADADFTEDAGYRAAARLLARAEPTAVVAVNDLVALGAMSAAADHGLRLPEQLAVTGYDDSFVAAVRQISLTSVDPDTRGIAVRAATLLLDRIGGASGAPTEHLLPPTLVTRASSAPAPPRRLPARS